MDRLRKRDSELVDKLLPPLLAYANDRLDVLGRPAVFPIHPGDEAAISEELWKNTDIIDDYVDEHSEFTDAEKELLLSWKRVVLSNFFVIRVDDEGTVFVNSDHVYRVVSAHTPFSRLPGFRTFRLRFARLCSRFETSFFPMDSSGPVRPDMWGIRSSS